MIIHINYRLSMGFDIEHNDDICHVVGDDEGRFERKRGYPEVGESQAGGFGWIQSWSKLFAVLFLRFVDVTKILGGMGDARFCKCCRFFF